MIWLLVFFGLWLAFQLAIGFLWIAVDGAWWPFGPRYVVVRLDGKEDRPIECSDSSRGADGVSGVVRGARQDNLASFDGTHPHLQCGSEEGRCSGDGEALPGHRGSGSPEKSGLQGAGQGNGASSFRAELERRATEAGFRR